jgi:adenylosuccinate lyase
MIEKHLNQELQFMATENILMDAVNHGGDRQELHERIRLLSIAASDEYKQNGKDIDLIKRIAEDSHFEAIRAQIDDYLDPQQYTGRAEAQTLEFLEQIQIYLE